MYQGPEALFPHPCANELPNGTVLLIPWELQDNADHSRYTIAPFMICHPPANTPDIEENAWYGYFLRQSISYLQDHSQSKKQRTHRQNLAAPWYICPRAKEGKFEKFTEFNTLSIIFPEDYQYYGTRIVPFQAEFIDIVTAIKSIPSFKSNIISIREILKVPGESVLDQEAVFVNNGLDMALYPEKIKAFHPRYWFGNDDNTYESLFENVQPLAELSYDLILVKFPSDVILQILKDPLLQDYTQSVYIPFSKMIRQPNIIRALKTGNEIENKILPIIRKEVKKNKR